MMKNISKLNKILIVLASLPLSLAGCATPQETITPTSYLPAGTEMHLPTRTPEPTATTTVTGTATPSSVIPEPSGCLKPSDDYTRVNVNGETLNQRTMSMLVHAQSLYGGELEIIGYAITQGSYSNSVSASFGTHAGGGAVDLSVLRLGTYTVLWGDIETLLHALRTAGFAAWLREYGELYEGSPIHIHAIAIGDVELSVAAAEQLTGLAGYFRGYSGLTDVNDAPTLDRFGGPVLCTWMINLGYQDLR